MVYIIAYVGAYIGSLILGVVWNIVLFKEIYMQAVGPMLRPNPLFPVGLTAIAINCAAILMVFTWIYPTGNFSPLKGIGMFALLWTPNLVGSFAGAAKLQIENVPRYLTMEIGFSALNVVVLGALLSFILSFAK